MHPGITQDEVFHVVTIDCEMNKLRLFAKKLKEILDKTGINFNKE